MNIVIDDFNINNVFFQQPVKNTVIENSHFIGLIYSDDEMSMNSICTETNFNIHNFDRMYKNKNLYIE